MSAVEVENHHSFMERFQKIYTSEEMEKLEFAYELAKHGHRNQKRDSGIRYFEHVRATALILADELSIHDLDLIVAALLHDMLEDSYLLTKERIINNFGPRVAYLVETVTKPKKNDSRFVSDRERHDWYFAQIKNGDVSVKLIKLCDRLHNMRSIKDCALEKQARKIKETKDIYLPLIADVVVQFPEKASYLETALLAAIE